MARPSRVEFAGACYLVTTRGNASERVFVDSGDGKLWMKTFRSVCSRFGWVCYAYCLMGNHYHIVIETPEPNLSAGMRQLNGVYTQAFNRKHGRSGHIFTGRFQSVVFQKEKYLKPVVRHVLSNPVRNGLVNSPVQWKWSSCRACCGKEKVDLTDSGGIAGMFGGMREFENFVSTPSPVNIRNEIKRQIYLGDDGFIEKTAKSAPGHRKNEDAAWAVPAVSAARFTRSPAQRNEAIFKAYSSGALSMKEISGLFGIHHSTVSGIIGKYESLLPREFKKAV